MSVTRPIAVVLLAIGVVLSVGASGCSNTGAKGDLLDLIRPRVTQPPDPNPDSPVSALRLLEWSYNNRSFARCPELFTRDYRFYFSPQDTAGARYLDAGWLRDDELISTVHLFSGGSAHQPPAVRIRLALDRVLRVEPDPRSSAWDPTGRWHKKINTQIVLNVVTADGSGISVYSATKFCLVRGDSADIPADLVARGFGPDSTRWWIGRWDDETGGAGGTPDRSSRRGGAEVAKRPPVLAPQPGSNMTLGRIKVWYR